MLYLQKKLRSIIAIGRSVLQKENQLDFSIPVKDQTFINSIIDKINSTFDIKMAKVSDNQDSQWLDTAITWSKGISLEMSIKAKHREQQIIKEKIEKRCAMIVSEQGRMINSALDRMKKRIVVDYTWG